MMVASTPSQKRTKKPQSNKVEVEDELRKFIDQFDSEQVKPSRADATHKRSRFVLAPSMGELDWEHLKKSDAALCKMVELTMKELDRAGVSSDEGLPWAKIISIFNQCPFLVVDEQSEQERHRSFVKQTGRWLSGSGRSKENISVSEVVRQWFKELINNDDVLNTTTVDLELAQDMVARTGLQGKGKRAFIKGLFSQEDFRKSTLYDVGVLRYPDSEHPYIRVYRLQVSAWSICRRGFLAIRDDNDNGLIGDFHTVKYRPRRAILDQMCPNLAAEAGAEIVTRYDFDIKPEPQGSKN